MSKTGNTTVPTGPAISRDKVTGNTTVPTGPAISRDKVTGNTSIPPIPINLTNLIQSDIDILQKAGFLRSTTICSASTLFAEWLTLDKVIDRRYMWGQLNLIETLENRHNLKLFVEQVLPILLKEYVKTPQLVTTHAPIPGFISRLAFWKLCVANEWFAVQQILDTMFEQSDPDFYYLCRILCQLNGTAGDHFAELDSMWFTEFIEKTTPTHQPMWLDFVNTNSNTFTGCAMWYLLPKFKSQMEPPIINKCIINWIHNTRYYNHFPSVSLLTDKYPFSHYSQAYRAACTSKQFSLPKDIILSIFKYLATDQKYTIIKDQIDLIKRLSHPLFGNVPHIKWILSQYQSTDPTDCLEIEQGLITHITNKWTGRLISYRIEYPASGTDTSSLIPRTDIDLFNKEIEWIRESNIPQTRLDNQMTNWYNTQTVSVQKVCRWFATLNLFTVNWFKIWFGLN